MEDENRNKDQEQRNNSVANKNIVYTNPGVTENKVTHFKHFQFY